MKENAKKTTIQLIKYGVIGCMNTLLTLAVFYMCNTWLKVNPLVANALGYVIGVLNSFVWNRHWVFKTNSKLKRELLLFSIGFLICYSLQFVTFWLLLNVCGFNNLEVPFIPMKNPGENVAMVISMVVYTVCNYTYNRLVTFKHD